MKKIFVSTALVLVISFIISMFALDANAKRCVTNCYGKPPRCVTTCY